MIVVEIGYALADKQKLLRLSVPDGTTVREAVLQSGMDQHFPGLDLAGSPLGIFGKAVAKPRRFHVNRQANSLTPNLWHFASICLKNADKRPIHQSPARFSLKRPGLNPFAQDKDAL